MDRAWQWVVDGPAVRVGVTTSRRDLTTSTVVIAGHRALLIDPAWDPDELAGIAADLRRLGVTVAAGFATHAHHDHVLWHPGLGPGPRCGGQPPHFGQLLRDQRLGQGPYLLLGQPLPPPL